jgi:hypothetical protein
MIGSFSRAPDRRQNLGVEDKGIPSLLNFASKAHTLYVTHDNLYS